MSIEEIAKQIALEACKSNKCWPDVCVIARAAESVLRSLPVEGVKLKSTARDREYVRTLRFDAPYVIDDFDSLSAALALAQAQIRDREAEILRIRTHENIAAVTLDKELNREQRDALKVACDELALSQARVRELETRVVNLVVAAGDDLEGEP